MRVFLPFIIAIGIGLPSVGVARTLSYQFPLETQFQDLSVEPTGSLELGRGFSINSGLVFESATELYAETIVLRHEGERTSLWCGKINPGFGQAWDQDVVPLASHASEYELSGKLGVGGSLVLSENDSSTLQMSATVFQHSDYSAYVLSTEVQTNSGISFIGSTINSQDRQGQLIGLRAQIQIRDNVLEPLFEFAHLGDEKIASTGIGIQTKQAYLTIQHSTRILSDRTDSLVQASLRWTP